MLELKTKGQLATDAFKLAAGQQLVRYNNVTYIPADYETRLFDVVPDPERAIWLPMTRDRIQAMAAEQFDTLFGNDSELNNFAFMVAQSARQVTEVVSSLLVKTEQGLRQLTDEGKLVPTSGEFHPNALVPMLNEKKKDKARVFAVISQWLDSDEEAESLLRHLATSLAPGWSAVKYVILLGEGRNGKGVLLDMLTGLFGVDNVSNVPRQELSQGTPMAIELNGKLLNLVYDGPAEYLKDSGREKSLIAGERVSIKDLYKSAPVQVQTNALFIEGLNHEPKTKDKSSALQKRLVRFQFPNIYALNHRFRRNMLAEDSLGALLSLMIDRYVREDDVAEALAPTAKAIELQLEQMYSNSYGLQFIKWLEEHDAIGATVLLGEPIGELVKRFQSWRLKENDLGTWAEPDVVAMFLPLVNTERRSMRDSGKVKKIRIVTSFRTETTQFIDTLKGDEDADDAELIAALVED